jgi:hypothetical protein
MGMFRVMGVRVKVKGTATVDGGGGGGAPLSPQSLEGNHAAQFAVMDTKIIY